MDIYPAVLDGDVSRQDIYAAVEDALITTHVGNEPTTLLVIGADYSGRLLEISTVVKHEDILVVHAAEARAEYRTLLNDPTAANLQDESESPLAAGFGRSADGLALTEPLIQDLFNAAEIGYDVERLSRRTRPGRPAPLTVGGVVRLGLDATLLEAVSTGAAAEGVPVTDFVEGILRQYLSVVA